MWIGCLRLVLILTIVHFSLGSAIKVLDNKNFLILCEYYPKYISYPIKPNTNYTNLSVSCRGNSPVSYTQVTISSITTSQLLLDEPLPIPLVLVYPLLHYHYSKPKCQTPSLFIRSIILPPIAENVLGLGLIIRSAPWTYSYLLWCRFVACSQMFYHHICFFCATKPYTTYL